MLKNVFLATITVASLCLSNVYAIKIGQDGSSDEPSSGSKRVYPIDNAYSDQSSSRSIAVDNQESLESLSSPLPLVAQSEPDESEYLEYLGSLDPELEGIGDFEYLDYLKAKTYYEDMAAVDDDHESLESSSYLERSSYLHSLDVQSEPDESDYIDYLGSLDPKLDGIDEFDFSDYLNPESCYEDSIKRRRVDPITRLDPNDPNTYATSSDDIEHYRSRLLDCQENIATLNNQIRVWTETLKEIYISEGIRTEALLQIESLNTRLQHEQTILSSTMRVQAENRRLRNAFFNPKLKKSGIELKKVFNQAFIKGLLCLADHEKQGENYLTFKDIQNLIEALYPFKAHFVSVIDLE